MSRYVILLIFCYALVSFPACINDKGKNIPDVSHIDISLNVKHFEQDLRQLDTTDIDKGYEELVTKYPVFLKEIYLGKILPVLQQPEVFPTFLKSPGIRHLMDTVNIVYSDFSEYASDFEEVFRFHKYYFPDREIPQLITFISEYTLMAFTYEGILGVGLDFFLGENYPGYDPNIFPKYIRQTMNKDHLVAKAMEAVANDLVGASKGEKLLDLMINNGKVFYVLDCLLPHTADSIKLGYTAAQTEWCNNNELQLWAHFLNEDLLYATSLRDIRKLVDHSPNSPGMPAEAPGRTANWTGWQIIKAYMKRNPEMTLSQLIAIEDAQQILNQAKYKPR